jgi:hypothetical protein
MLLENEATKEGNNETISYNLIARSEYRNSLKAM